MSLLRSTNPPDCTATLTIIIALGCLCIGVLDGGEPRPTPAEPPGPVREETARSEAPDDASPVRPQIQRVSKTGYRLGSIRFDEKSREIRIPATVNLRDQLLEYALVGENGKLHESLFATKANPFNLNVVILLLGFRSSQAVLNPVYQAERRIANESPETLGKSQLDVFVEWRQRDDESGKGEVRTLRLEDCLKKLGGRKKVPPGPWIYTGSSISEGRFLAESGGSILALYLDPNAMINNPREQNFNDEVWLPSEAIPNIGTPVTIIIRPAVKPVKSSKSSSNS